MSLKDKIAGYFRQGPDHIFSGNLIATGRIKQRNGKSIEGNATAIDVVEARCDVLEGWWDYIFIPANLFESMSGSLALSDFARRPCWDMDKASDEEVIAAFGLHG